MKICVVEMISFVVISILFACGNCEPVHPRMLLADGTVLDYQHDILYGEPLEIFCMGIDYELQMADGVVPLPTTSVNQTTIRLFEERPEKGVSYYTCHYIKNNSLHYPTIMLKVVVDGVPVIEDFRCKSMNFEYLNCSWTTTNINPEYELYYVKNGILTLLYKIRWFAKTIYCVWDDKNALLPYQYQDVNLTFLVKTCTGLGCTNQTFQFDQRAIVKFKAPKLEIKAKGSYGAILRCNIYSSGLYQQFGNYNLEQKITYWYSGIHQNQGNVPVVITDIYSSKYDDNAIELKLPCANEFYEVRLSVRPQLAEGEEFWSEDAIVHFVTEPASGDEGPVDPTCNKPKAKVTPEVMLYIIDQFTEKMKEEQNKLKTKIKAMKYNNNHNMMIEKQ